jgi:cobalt-zinc-cadmium efflux system outer membrane protein
LQTVFSPNIAVGLIFAGPLRCELLAIVQNLGVLTRHRLSKSIDLSVSLSKSIKQAEVLRFRLTQVSMFPQRFSTNWLTILIIAISLVASTSDNKVVAQVNSMQSAKGRIESPTERRLREKMKNDRTFLVGTPTATDATTRMERRIRNEIANRRFVPGLRTNTISSNLENPSVAVKNDEQFGVIELTEPKGSPDNGRIEAWNASGEQISGESNSQPSGGRDLGSLESFEQLAFENHPTLNIAVARILAARHEALQAGLHPNPQLGLFIDELGNDNDPGLWGAYLQHYVVRGNKLAIGRKVKDREAGVLEVEFETQILRIKTDVRTAFYKLLIAQEKHQLAKQLQQAQQDAVSKSSQLFKAGETPKTDLLQTQLQAQKAMILLNDSEILKQNAWRRLAAVVGEPGLPIRNISGSFEPIAETVSFTYCLEQILTNSPELLAAKAEVERVRTTIQQETAKSIPNYQTQVSLGRDSNSNHFFTGLQLQVPLQVYDRNQGNIAAAKSRLVAAQNNVEKIKLDLSKRLATEYQLYQMGVVKSDLYASKLLPNAQQTLDLLASGYPEEVSFLRLVTAQQTVIDITIEYLNAIDQRWSSRLKIEGMLLDNSLNQ